MNNLHAPDRARSATARANIIRLDNDAKVRLGVGCTIGSCVLAMLLMVPV